MVVTYLAFLNSLSYQAYFVPVSKQSEKKDLLDKKEFILFMSGPSKMIYLCNCVFISKMFHGFHFSKIPFIVSVGNLKR